MKEFFNRHKTSKVHFGDHRNELIKNSSSCIDWIKYNKRHMQSFCIWQKLLRRNYEREMKCFEKKNRLCSYANSSVTPASSNSCFCSSSNSLPVISRLISLSGATCLSLIFPTLSCPTT